MRAGASQSGLSAYLMGLAAPDGTTTPPKGLIVAYARETEDDDGCHHC